jgi:metal-responsive CopG/Arc/MetJ family transcriptional regulator
MAAVKRTYAFPEETVQEFEQVVASGKRSTILTDMMKRWLEERKRAELRQAVIEGCLEMADVHLEIEKQFEFADAEVAREFYDAD